MGKREQMIRVLILAAESFGFTPDGWGDNNLDDAIDGAEQWMRRRFSGKQPVEFEAWFCLLDRLKTEAPAGSSADEPRAETVMLGFGC